MPAPSPRAGPSEQGFSYQDFRYSATRVSPTACGFLACRVGAALICRKASRPIVARVHDHWALRIRRRERAAGAVTQEAVERLLTMRLISVCARGNSGRALRPHSEEPASSGSLEGWPRGKAVRMRHPARRTGRLETARPAAFGAEPERARQREKKAWAATLVVRRPVA